MALLRYFLIQEAADRALVSGERSPLVRAPAARDHTGRGGERVRLARDRIDRWMRAWRAGGCEALVLRPRLQPTPPAAVRDLAARLKRETPGCTAAQVAAVIATAQGWGPSTALPPQWPPLPERSTR